MTKNILIVEDEASIREALSKVLQNEKYEVISAENGREAVGKFKMRKMDLVVLDLGLPVKDGWQTMQWLTRVNPHLPVIIITGRCNQREPAEKMGAQVLMEKPLDVPRLLQLIRELIEVPMESRNLPPSGFRHIPGDHELVLTSLTVPATISGGENPDRQEY